MSDQKSEVEAVQAAPIAPSEVPPQIMPDSISRDDDKVAMSRLFRDARISRGYGRGQSPCTARI